MMAASICVKGHNYYNNNAAISIQTFYNELAPYGEWIYTPDYGYAWRPYLGYYEDFRPYATKGNWVYTDLGWTWVSEYRWGWATFHYGRWFYDNYFGWMWLPGDEWAPAWVTWGTYNDYWAWAPMGPNIHVNVNMEWYAPDFWWTMVPRRNFCSHNWHSYIYNRPVQVTNITYITNVYSGNNENHSNWHWYNGPRKVEVEKHARTKVQTRTITDVDKPVTVASRTNSIPVYRPEVTKREERSRPANYRTVEKSKTDSRTTENSRINTRTTPAEKRTTVTTTKRYGEPGVAPKPPVQKQEIKTNRHQETRVAPRSSSQTSDKRNKSTVNTRQVEKPAPTRVEPARTNPSTTRRK